MSVITIIQGHPDPAQPHFCHAVEQAYAGAARAAGHVVHVLPVARLQFSLLRSADEFEHGQLPADIALAQQLISAADHLLIIYPLWLGSMPALLKGFLEQTFRPGFAFDPKAKGWKKPLRGRSCRIVVTMGMPAPIYRWFFGAHSLKSLERNILGFCGIGPIQTSLIGNIEGQAEARQHWLEKIADMGRNAR